MPTWATSSPTGRSPREADRGSGGDVAPTGRRRRSHVIHYQTVIYRRQLSSSPCRPPPKRCEPPLCTPAIRRREHASCPSRAGRCPCSTRASARSTWPCASGAGLFDVSHMGEIETSGPQAVDFLQRILSNDVVEDRRGRLAVLGAVQGGRRRPGRPLHLPPGRGPLPDGDQRVEPREGLRLVRGHAAASRWRSRTPLAATRCWRSRAPMPGRSWRGTSRATPLSHAHRHGEGRRSRDAGVRHGLHGRGRRGAAAAARGRRAGLGRAGGRRRHAGRASARATPCA